MVICFFVTTADAEYNLYGVGGLSCREWVSKRKDGDWFDMGEWMLGFISAVGYYDIYMLKDLHAQSLAEWMDKYCQQKPLDEFAEGVKKLVEELNVNSIR